MKIKYKKELKLATDLEVGDDIRIGGLLCTVKKVEDVFHHMPKSRTRISLEIVGAPPRKAEAILFLPQGTPIETLK